MTLKIAAPFVAALSLLALPASSATLTLDPATFNAATAGYAFETETFDGYNFTNQSSYDFGDFTASGPEFDATTSTFCFSGPCLTSISQTVTLTFDNALKALRFDLNSGSGETFVVDGVLIGTSGGAYTYAAGIYAPDTPFKSITITANGTFPQNLFDIDNLSYSIAPIGLPATMPLLAGGLFLTQWMRRRKS